MGSLDADAFSVEQQPGHPDGKPPEAVDALTARFTSQCGNNRVQLLQKKARI